MISPGGHEIGTFGYALVTKQTATKARSKGAGLRKFIEKRKELPPINHAARRANEAISDATTELVAARTPPERRAVLEKLRRLVVADIARVDGEDRAAAVRVAEAEAAVMRTLKGAQLDGALRAAAVAIAVESGDQLFATFTPQGEDIQILERKLRNGVKGRWLVYGHTLSLRRGRVAPRARPRA